MLAGRTPLEAHEDAFEMHNRLIGSDAEDANLLCAAASAMYYDVAFAESVKTGLPVRLPGLLSPVGRPQALWTFPPEVLEEAERFLFRLGMIYFDDHYRTRLKLD